MESPWDRETSVSQLRGRDPPPPPPKADDALFSSFGAETVALCEDSVVSEFLELTLLIFKESNHGCKNVQPLSAFNLLFTVQTVLKNDKSSKSEA